MLTDSSLSRVKSPKRRAIGAVKKRWSDNQKLEAVQTYILLGGNLALTAKTLQISLNTMKEWKSSEWWRDIEKDIKTQERLTLSVKLRNIVDKSLSLVQDRLENGDYIYDQKTGQLKRKPVVLRDVHRVASDLIDRKAKLDMVDDSRLSQESIEEKLAKLAENFKSLADKNLQKPTVEVTDVVFATETSHEVGG